MVEGRRQRHFHRELPVPVKCAELATPAALCGTASSESSHRHGDPPEPDRCNSVLQYDTGVRPFDPRALVVVVVVVYVSGVEWAVVVVVG